MFKDEALDEIDEARKQRSGHQALLGVSVESSTNYPLLADENFLARFDLLETLSRNGKECEPCCAARVSGIQWL